MSVIDGTGLSWELYFHDESWLVVVGSTMNELFRETPRCWVGGQS